MHSAASTLTGGRRRRAGIAVAALALALTAGACGGDSDPPASSAAADGADGTVLTIRDFAFGPEPLVVPRGSVVRVVNEDEAPHTATADDQSFDTGELGRGGEARITLPEKGEVAYHCTIHDYMRGVIRVAD